MASRALLVLSCSGPLLAQVHGACGQTKIVPPNPTDKLFGHHLATNGSEVYVPVMGVGGVNDVYYYAPFSTALAGKLSGPTGYDLFGWRIAAGKRWTADE